MLGLLRLKLPGTNSIATDLSETAMIGSAFVLASPWLTLVPCAIQALNTVPGAFFVHPDSTNTFVMHAVAVPAAWWAHRALSRRGLSHLRLGLAWAAFVVVYYYGLLVPALVASNWLFQTATAARFPGPGGLYLSIARAWRFEMVFTAGVTSLAFITEQELRRRRAAEERLREALEAQEALLAAAPVAIFSVSPAGHVASWNAAAEQLFGRTAAQARGGPSPRVRRAGARADDHGSLVDGVVAGAPLLGVDGEIEVVGRAIPVAVFGAPLRDAAGDPAGAVVLVEDLRDRLALRAKVQESATMSALGQLVGGLAHELRNPLFGLSAVLDALGPRLTGDPRLEQLDRALRGQVGHLTALVTDLLDYGKAGGGEALTAASVELPLFHALADCAAQAAAGGVSLDVAVPAGLPAVPMDALRLVQVFRNLIQNAIAFSPPGASVRIEAAARRAGDDGAERLGGGDAGIASGRDADGAERRDLVRVVVLDRGRGIPPEDLARVFDPFFSRRSGGTGLGLSIVRRIVDHHGGTVEAGNREGGGACVTVWLPAEAPRFG
ncbi:MAG TPA: ATP-binding protein [Kofleriaceae bacterium]|nr:ATP-binding protein [Kofleriaceae bacterium]